VVISVNPDVGERLISIVYPFSRVFGSSHVSAIDVVDVAAAVTELGG